MGGVDSATQKALLCVVLNSLRDTAVSRNVCVVGMKIMRGLCSVQCKLALSAAPLFLVHAEASLHLLLLFFNSNLNHSLETAKILICILYIKHVSARVSLWASTI